VVESDILIADVFLMFLFAALESNYKFGYYFPLKISAIPYTCGYHKVTAATLRSKVTPGT
jgi:hypothetical protein